MSLWMKCSLSSNTNFLARLSAIAGNFFLRAFSVSTLLPGTVWHSFVWTSTKIPSLPVCFCHLVNLVPVPWLHFMIFGTLQICVCRCIWALNWIIGCNEIVLRSCREEFRTWLSTGIQGPAEYDEQHGAHAVEEGFGEWSGAHPTLPWSVEPSHGQHNERSTEAAGDSVEDCQPASHHVVKNYKAEECGAGWNGDGRQSAEWWSGCFVWWEIVCSLWCGIFVSVLMSVLKQNVDLFIAQWWSLFYTELMIYDIQKD